MKHLDNKIEFTTSLTLEKEFISLIQTRFGIVISNHQKSNLHKTILSACQKFNYTPDEYFKILSTCPIDSPQIKHLISGITIQETYFFRDNQQIKLIEKTILPTLIKNKRSSGELSLRIWSAGCSTGEEIYTIAMLLNEILPDIDHWNIKLLATDINTTSLQKAISGQYNEWSMRTTNEYYKNKYFSKNNSKYTIESSISEWINFEYLNLNDPNIPSIINETNAQDFIICRNVFIYFDLKNIEELMKKFSKSLAPGGYLILGASDPIINKDNDLIYYFSDGPMFIKQSISTGTSVKLKKEPIHFTVNDKKSELYVIETNKKPVIYSSISIQNNTALIAQHIKNANWQEIINISQTLAKTEINTNFMFNSMAMAYANLGILDSAMQCAENSLTLDNTNIQAHFILAMVQIELNCLSDAEKHLRNVLYLDHQFVVGHFQLGLLLFRKKLYKEGLKCLRNALKIADAKDSNSIVEGTQYLTYQRLKEILKNELDIYQIDNHKS